MLSHMIRDVASSNAFIREFAVGVALTCVQKSCYSVKIAVFFLEVHLDMFFLRYVVMECFICGTCLDTSV